MLSSTRSVSPGKRDNTDDSDGESDVKGNDGLELLVGSVLGSLSCLMQHGGFDPPLRRIFLVEGIYPLELTWVLTPFPQKSF